MKIKVTQAHIDNGQKRSTNDCPISLALRAKFYPNKLEGWHVSTHVVCKEPYEQIVLPKNVQDFIRDFDGNYKVAPFTFEIDLGNIAG